jgi:hypothetical protein
VVFQSLSALVPSDTNEDVDVYLFDLAVGSLELVSVAPGGGPGNAASAHPTISGSGDLVAFDSSATDLIVGDTNGQRDAFLRDLTLGTTERVSLSTAGTQVAGGSVNVVVSPGGERVLFRSWASDLVPHDTNAVDDIFVRELAGCSATVATYCAPSTPSVPGCTATLGSTGVPSLSAPAAFHVRALRVPGGVRGLAYLGARGPAGTPLGTQGGSLCVAPPAWRSAPKGSGGSIGACDGQLDYTLQELVSASGGRIAAGDTIHVALWFRDPAAHDGFGLSDGLWFQVCP